MNSKDITEIHWKAHDKRKSVFINRDAGKQIEKHIVDMLDSFEPGSMDFDPERSPIEKVGYLWQLLACAYDRGVTQGKDLACLALVKLIKNET